MKGINTFIYLLINVTSIFYACYVNAESVDNNLFKKNVLVIKNNNSQFYNQSLMVLNKNMLDSYNFIIKNVSDKPSLDNIQLVITLGYASAVYSRQYFPDTQKIFSYISLSQSENLGIKDNETHLLIELKPEDYINFAQSILPNKTLGILHQKSDIIHFSKINKNLYFSEISPYNKIITATRNIIKTADILLALPNKNIFNRHSLKGILLTTYQNRTPMISYSPAHVKAGAVAAIYASTENLGQHLSETIKHLLDGKQVTTQQYAKYYSSKINQKVAQSLRLDLNTNSHFLNSKAVNNNE